MGAHPASENVPLTPSPFWFLEKQTPLSLFLSPSPFPLSSQFLPRPALNTKSSCLPLTAQGLQSPDTGPALWRSGARGLQPGQDTAHSFR